MSRLPSEQGFQPGSVRDAGWRRYERELRERERGRGGPSGWMIAGLALLGLGALGWYYLGPDLRRYMKIRSM
jgi:hypothetical protein